MQKYFNNRLLFVPSIFLIAATFLDSCPAKSADQPAKSVVLQSKYLSGSVSENALIDNLERLGISCLIQTGTPTRLIVDRVRMGSSAFYGGISKGDFITNLKQVSPGNFILVIAREGKNYQLSLHTLSGQLAENVLRGGAQNNLLKGKASRQTDQQEPDRLAGAATTAPIRTALEPDKKLIPYDVELLIDITGSMNEMDGTGELSKFQWCHEQVRNLAQKLDPYHKTLTITTFNNSFETEEQCTPKRVEEIYASINPRGGTDLVEPLRSRLNRALIKHRASGHPVIIAVITDGEPNIPADPHVVNEALIEFTHSLSAEDDVLVTFLQIGDTFAGHHFCLDLDNNLVNEGATYDIVDTTTFDELKHEGLVNALVDSIIASNNHKAMPRGKKIPTNEQRASTSVAVTNSRLKSLQEQRKEIERQLLGQ